MGIFRGYRNLQEAMREPHQGKREAERRRRQRLTRAEREQRPVPGSQEWAETRGDDLGESPDY